MTTPTPQDFSAITALRPTDDDLDAAWTPERRAAVTDRIRTAIARESTTEIATDPAASRHIASIHRKALATPAVAQGISRRRTVLVTTGIAAAVAALLAIPLLVPSGSPAGPPSASALEALAATAAAEKPLQPGQFRHAVNQSTQNGHVITRESWTAADGHLWRVDAASGTSMYYAFPPGEDSINSPSPAFLATLPTDPAALATYLRANVHGSSSTDEAMFVAVGDMLDGGFAPPSLRAAALRVLEQVPHVRAYPGQDSLGRAATVVEFVDESIRPGEVQTLYFDPDSSNLTQESETVGDHSYSDVVVSTDVVTSVPDLVVRYGSYSPDGTCVTAAGIQEDDLVCIKALTAGGETTSASAAPSTSNAASTAGSAAPAN